MSHDHWHGGPNPSCSKLRWSEEDFFLCAEAFALLKAQVQEFRR